MDSSGQNHLTKVQAPPAPPADGMTWGWLAWQMRLRGPDFEPPPHLRGLPLSYVEGKAREEQQAELGAKEARANAARLANTPKSSEPAPSPEVQAVPARQGAVSGGWRQRARYLNNLRRCSTFREAAARTGIDESTARRWRVKYPKFAERCAEVVAGRYAEQSDDLKLRAGRPRTRPCFYRGQKIGEQVVHDDRPLMFLLKLEDGQRARAEAREERRLQREHEIRLKEMEIAAREVAREAARVARPLARANPTRPFDLTRRMAEADARMKRFEEQDAAHSGMHASAAHPPSPAGDGLDRESNGLSDVLPEVGPPRVVEVPGRPV